MLMNQSGAYELGCSALKYCYTLRRRVRTRANMLVINSLWWIYARLRFDSHTKSEFLLYNDLVGILPTRNMTVDSPKTLLGLTLQELTDVMLGARPALLSS